MPNDNPYQLGKEEGDTEKQESIQEVTSLPCVWMVPEDGMLKESSDRKLSCRPLIL